MKKNFLLRYALRKLVFTAMFLLPLFSVDALLTSPVFFCALSAACIWLCRCLWRAILRDQKRMRMHRMPAVPSAAPAVPSVRAARAAENRRAAALRTAA